MYFFLQLQSYSHIKTTGKNTKEHFSPKSNIDFQLILKLAQTKTTCHKNIAVHLKTASSVLAVKFDNIPWTRLTKLLRIQISIQSYWAKLIHIWYFSLFQLVGYFKVEITLSLKIHLIWYQIQTIKKILNLWTILISNKSTNSFIFTNSLNVWMYAEV